MGNNKVWGGIVSWKIFNPLRTLYLILLAWVLSDPERYLGTLELMLTCLMRSQKDPDMMKDTFELWRAFIQLFTSKSEKD